MDSDELRFLEAQKLLSQSPFPAHSPVSSFWIDPNLQTFEQEIRNTILKQEEAYQIVIIGGGLTGVSAAYWLTEFGVPAAGILLLESRDIACGATGRNGGHCWPSTKVFDDFMLEKWGEKNLEAAEEWKFRSARLFMDWLVQNQIDCEFFKTGSCNLAKYQEDLDEYNEYINDKSSKLKEKLGVQVDLWTPEQCEALHSTAWKGALHQDLAGQFWPRKAVLEMTKILLDRGVNIRTQTQVQQIIRSRGNFQLEIQVDQKLTINAHKIIHCTNGYSTGLIPHLSGVIIPVRGQVVATSPINGFLVPKSLSINDGYEYLIHRQADRRIIYGGMRWRAGSIGKEVGIFDDSVVDLTVSTALQDSLMDTFPWLEKENMRLEKEWTGIMGYSCDGYPLIGKLSDEEEYIAAGYSGNGMPQCFGAAKAVVELMLGHISFDEWIPQFNPKRFEDQAYLERFKYTGKTPLKADE